MSDDFCDGRTARADHEPPPAIQRWGWRYHHTGIPTDQPHAGERYLAAFKMYVSGFPESPYGVEWMRFEPDSPVADLVKTLPHVAFEVDDMDEALAGKQVLTSPGAPSAGVRAAMIVDRGAPVELLQFERAERPDGREQGESHELRPIGVIRSPHRAKEECPIQPAFAADAKGSVEVFPQFAAGLKDIETFSHIYLLYLFDRSGATELVRPTFLDDTPRGVFASRHPCRPNGIGLSVVRLLERRGEVLIVSGIDVLDGTPLLDIKPYMPRYDVIEDATMGWAVNVKCRRKPRDRER